MPRSPLSSFPENAVLRHTIDNHTTVAHIVTVDAEEDYRMICTEWGWCYETLEDFVRQHYKHLHRRAPSPLHAWSACSVLVDGSWWPCTEMVAPAAPAAPAAAAAGPSMQIEEEAPLYEIQPVLYAFGPNGQDGAYPFVSANQLSEIAKAHPTVHTFHVCIPCFPTLRLASSSITGAVLDTLDASLNVFERLQDLRLL